MLKVTLTSLDSGESLDLDEISQNGEGVEAVSGLTGLGLHAVDVQWFEGAGDGARPRNIRALPRVVDIPLFVGMTEGRAALKAKLRELSRVVSGTVRISLTDDEDDSSYHADFVRVGGGTVTYGVDTTGTTDWESIITFQSGSPYWTSVEVVEDSFTSVDIPPFLTIANDGTAEVYPTFTFVGPGLGFKLTSPRGEVFHFTEFIPAWQSITVDMENCTVVDQTGTSRYSALAPAPQFFSLPPGDNTVLLEYDRSSAAFIAAGGGGRRNVVTNPAFSTNGAGWTTTSRWAYDATNHRLAHAPYETWDEIAQDDINMGAKVFGGELLPGKTYQVRVDLVSTYDDLLAIASSDDVTARVDQPIRIKLLHGGNNSLLYQEEIELGAFSQAVSFTFVAPTTAASLVIVPGGHHWVAETTGDPHYRSQGLSLDNVFMGEPGPFFTGDTTDTFHHTYSWSGTANASTSIEVGAGGSEAGSEVSYSFNPRDRMVL